MKSENLRTMEFVGVDSFDHPVYKCVESGQLWKDITLGSETPWLHSCNNDFDGEPGYPIRDDLEICFVNKYKETPNSNNYAILDRMRSQCDYYLGYGNRNKYFLACDTEQEHISVMKKIWNTFPKDEKPEWLTWERILEYEKEMTRKQI